MANRRRQDSSRASWLARKSEKSIGRILVQMPPGERKSGIPHSVEMPAPVNGTMTFASSISSRRRAMALFTSGAIMACPASRSLASQRLLLVPTFLAGELDAGFAFGRRHAVFRAAFSACGLDPGRALLDGDGFFRHRLADQPLGLLAHRLLRHLVPFKSASFRRCDLPPGAIS